MTLHFNEMLMSDNNDRLALLVRDVIRTLDNYVIDRNERCNELLISMLLVDL